MALARVLVSDVKNELDNARETVWIPGWDRCSAAIKAIKLIKIQQVLVLIQITHFGLSYVSGV
jgi:hypothetical protein